MGYEIYDTRPSKENYKEPLRHAEFMCSSSHTYGNATAFIQNWLIDLFPKEYFKSINVKSRLAHRQIKSTPREYNKRTKPIFALSPRVDFDDPRFLDDTFLTNKLLPYHYTHDYGALLPFIVDNEHNYEVRFQLNRTVMYADIIIIVGTRMEQMNMMSYIMNKTTFNHNQDVMTCLESYLSKNLLGTISNIVNIPIEDENNNTGKFLRYLNSHSKYPITYKLQGATRTKEFYRYYPVTIDLLLDNLQADDGEQSGQVMTSYKINFTVRMEFFSTGFYFLFSRDKIPLHTSEEFMHNGIIVPTYTDVISTDDLFLPDGWNLFTNVSFQLEKSDDILDIRSSINTSIIEGIKYHLKNGLPLLDLVNIKIRKQGRELLENKDYNIDWNNLSIKFNVKDFNYYTFTLYFSINLEYLNTLIKSIFNLK